MMLKMPQNIQNLSFLHDHAYIHSDVEYKCEKCDKSFALLYPQVTTLDLGFIRALQGPVARNINGHRT